MWPAGNLETHRPENRPHAQIMSFIARDIRDPLLIESSPELHWTTSNVGEAMPGVHSPLSYTVWRAAIQYAAAGSAHATGALSVRERDRLPPPVQRPLLGAFYGRLAMQVEYFALIGDRMPGTTGPEVVRAILGRVPDGLISNPARHRYPAIAARLPVAFTTVPRRIRETARRTEEWYAAQMTQIPRANLSSAIAIFKEACATFQRNLLLQGLGMFASVQPLFSAIEWLVDRTGIGDVGVFSGSGGAEVTGIVSDLWSASRGQLAVGDVVRRHGFHGPLEGQLSSFVWRENDTPLRQLIERYANEPEARDPSMLAAANRRRRDELTHELVAVTPRRRRPAVRLLLRLAADRIPLRGVAKRSFLQAFDVARASARQAGECLAAEGQLGHSDDIFFVTNDELAGPLPRNVKSLIDLRRQRQAKYETLSIPSLWKGMPKPLASKETDQPVAEVTGIGVSTGVVEGLARVLDYPDFGQVEPGEILVAPFTDPSWASVMFVSAGLVVDIGGALSHAAVVARELGVPCVVNTQTGTTSIRTGDTLRVDGKTGVVKILAPCQTASTTDNTPDPLSHARGSL